MAVNEKILRHKLLNYKGMTLAIPAHREGTPVGSFTDVDIYTPSSSQLFPLATKLEFADGRLFRYGKFGEAVTPLTRMVVNGNLVPGSDDANGFEGALDSTSNYAVGSTTLIVDDVEDRIENYYEDGMLAVFPTLAYTVYRVIGNDAATSVDDVTIYLEDGLATALVAASTGVTLYPSIFNNLKSPPEAAGYDAFMGVPLCTAITSGYYGWIQRRGRCFVTPTSYFGDGANERMGQAVSDGTMALKAADGTQTIGYLTQKTVNGYGDAEMWLQFE